MISVATRKLKLNERLRLKALQDDIRNTTFGIFDDVTSLGAGTIFCLLLIYLGIANSKTFALSLLILYSALLFGFFTFKAIQKKQQEHHDGLIEMGNVMEIVAVECQLTILKSNDSKDRILQLKGQDGDLFYINHDLFEKQHLHVSDSFQLVLSSDRRRMPRASHTPAKTVLLAYNAYTKPKAIEEKIISEAEQHKLLKNTLKLNPFEEQKIRPHKYKIKEDLNFFQSQM